MPESELLTALGLQTFVVFDFETTGLSPETDRLIEIAALKYVNGKVADKFVTLVNPGFPISSMITDITGISNKMVAQSPNEEDLVDEFQEFLGDHPLVAHNISFDWSFLTALRRRYDQPEVANPRYDTLSLARTFLFDLPAFNLGTVSEYYGLSAEGSHRAEKDTENCGAIFLELVEEAASYRLAIITRILEILKPGDFANHELYSALARELVRKGKAKSGLIPPRRDHHMMNNTFFYEGETDITGLNASDVFGPDGYLAQSMDRFEDRPDQVRFSDFVSKTITGTPEFGIAEAGTGLGKSMAYLLPALQKAHESGGEVPVVISCYTKHLQDQLFHKDLPQLADAIQTPVKAVKLKGRSNYICLTRLDWVIRDGSRILSRNETECLLPLVVWLDWTETGDLQECNGFWGSRPGRLASMIQSEPGFCTTNLCQHHHGCFFGKLRRTTFEANLIIVNHALLLSEMNNPGLLPQYDTVIIDEAHNLIPTAYGQLSRKLDLFYVSTILQMLDPTTDTNKRWNDQIKPFVKLHAEFNDIYKALVTEIRNGTSAVNRFFESLEVHSTDRYSPSDPYTIKTILPNLAEEYGNVHSELTAFEASLNQLQEILQKWINGLLEKDPGRDEYPEIHPAFEQRLDLVKKLEETLSILTRDPQSGWVYWQEGSYKQNDRNATLYLSIHGSPVDLAEDLYSNFFSKLDYCVLTSATLRVDDQFHYFLNRIGLGPSRSETIRTAEFPSPFHYDDQVTYLQYAGPPSINNDPKAIAEVIFNLHSKYNRRMMVLFTSYRLLDSTYRILRKYPGGSELPIFAQVYGTSRWAILRGMHQSENGILLGTSAFWEGVDLPGELLEILVITKLPFDVPTEPIVRAYSASISERGGNPFMEFSVPECVIKLRQGFGRLIRTSHDEGIFVVLDDRIVTKRYGSHFMDAIPVRMSLMEGLNQFS
ncbi:MAG: hypothetical protein GXO90_09240 [FCB group bacterium]|nr:hypothetical protein [FCB group bacterium]